MRSQRLISGLVSFSSMTMVSRVFGLVRDQSIQIIFGANALTDAFWVAFRIPNFLRRLFAEGSFATAFVPVFTEVKETKTHTELRSFMAHMSGALAAVLIIVTACGMFFAPQLAGLFASGNTASVEKVSLLTQLLRLTFPFLLCVSLTALAGSALNSFQRFAIPAITPIILNICMIFGAVWLSPHLHTPILALGWAVLIGGILQLLFQLPALRRIGLLTLPRWGGAHPYVRKVLYLMVPTLFGSSIAQINLLLDTLIAAHLSVGSQSWLSLADRFLELPLGIFGVALGTVILPSLSRHYVKLDRMQFANALDWGLRVTLFIVLPAMTGLLLLARPMIAALFQYGHFSAFDTQMTVLSVYGLSLGLPAFALIKILLPAFYARQDTKTPVRAGLIAVVANMLLNFIYLGILFFTVLPAQERAHGFWFVLAHQPGLHLALGLASASSSYLNVGMLWYWLKRSGMCKPNPGWGIFCTRLLISCIAMALALGLLLHYLPDFTAMSRLGRVIGLCASVAIGAGVYIVSQAVLGLRVHHLREQ